MTLIDALYEHKVNPITAEVRAQAYTEGDGVFEFKRTAVRLIEMQSEAYFQSRHTIEMGMVPISNTMHRLLV